MRTLKFIVKGQIIEKDPKCDFSNLVPGSEQFLLAEFSFSREWQGTTKVAAFYSIMGKEYPPQLLHGSVPACLVPVEACAKKNFKIQVIGKNEEFTIKTNKVLVEQNGGK